MRIGKTEEKRKRKRSKVLVKVNILRELAEALRELEDLERKVDNEMQKK